MASRIYHDAFWFPMKGSRRARRILDTTGWGELFKSYA
jgi:hypothetical protein